MFVSPRTLFSHDFIKIVMGWCYLKIKKQEKQTLKNHSLNIENDAMYIEQEKRKRNHVNEYPY
ncbi:hypothetical protein BV923_04255 [Pectobacterium odoriferum]|nr:hypothetical protein BVY05_06900 [Pectobacterium odoriferum]POE24003.1 hypothetical protein BV923_04255 [Pectobacterium odoriferum]